MRRLRLASFALFAACLSPTQIDVILSSDACARIRLNDGVKLYFSTPDTIDDDALVETAVAHSCSGTRIGDIVVVPSHRMGDVAIRVVADVDGPDTCKKKDGYKGCIVARRILRFVEHTPLVLPINLDASCVDVACDSMSTCVNGGCVPATIDDPKACARPGGCTSDGGSPRAWTIDWLAAGRTATCMRISTGKVFCWGYDQNSGALALTPGPNLFVPTLVPSLDQFKQVTIGATHGCGIDKQGLLVCWGKNDLAQQGIGSANGAILAPAHNPYLGAVNQVHAGYGHTCAIALDGIVWCWGLDDHLQVGVQASQSGKPAQAGGAPMIAGLLATGNRHSCAMGGAGGTVGARCWGANDAHQAGGASDTATPTSVANASGQYLAAGETHSCVAANGTLLCWGDDPIVGSGSASPVPFNTPSMSTIDGVGAGEAFTCAHTMAGEIFCWGSNSFGQLGDGTTAGPKKLTQSTPAVPIGKPTIGMTVGVGHVCAWTKTEAWCWGSGALGQLGIGPATVVPTPTPIVLPP